VLREMRTTNARCIPIGSWTTIRLRKAKGYTACECSGETARSRQSCRIHQIQDVYLSSADSSVELHQRFQACRAMGVELKQMRIGA